MTECSYVPKNKHTVFHKKLYWICRPLLVCKCFCLPFVLLCAIDMTLFVQFNGLREILCVLLISDVHFYLIF